MRLADQIAERAAAIAVRHHAGRARMDAELVFDRDAAQIVVLTQAAIGVDQEFGHREQRDTLDPGRGTIDARQHQVHDVRRQIVLAIGDEYLLPADAVVLAIGAARARIAARSEPACGSVRFMVPVHSPLTILGSSRACSCAEAAVSSASAAPRASSGHSMKAILAPNPISSTATASTSGAP